MKRRNASILVGLLWCVAILSVVVVGVLRSASLDLRVVKNYGDRIQAHYLALAGIEKAKALLFLEARQRRQQNLNHTGEFYDSEEQFKEIEFGRGFFSVLRPGSPDEMERVVYGVADEESRLNVNYASAELMQEIPDLTQEIAAAIIDYRDSDSNVTQGGAELEEYAALEPPYLPHNAFLRTDRELLMVYGVTHQAYAGEDANLNGFLDPEEDDGDDNFPSDNENGRLDAGWSELITTHSGINNVAANGDTRLNIQSASEGELSQIDGISEELATAIVQYRSENEFRSLADLLGVRRMQQQNNNGGSPQNQQQRQGAPGPRGNFPPGFNGQIPANVQSRGQAGNNSGGGNNGGAGNMQPTGPELINEELLMQIADKLTMVNGLRQNGAININTAPLDVLVCIPGIDEQVASAIIRYRESSGYFPNIAHLLELGEIDREKFGQIAPHVSARSETFRILSEGIVPSSGARKRIQVIVQVDSSLVTTLAYREDLQ